MNILVIGGSYFFGRWFVEMARKEHSITVLNRGNIPLNLENVVEWTSDRRDVLTLDKLKGDRFDCIVDFCAYSAGDIEKIAECFGTVGTRYIFISTVDVYKKGTGAILTEESEMADFEMATNDMNGSTDEAFAYIQGKVILEKELLAVAVGTGMIPVSIRPAILYGPANYAPREKMYFDWIRKAGQILAPIDSDGQFQFIYVKDAAKGVLKLCELPDSQIETSYNFCDDKVYTYYLFHQVLHEINNGNDFEEIPVTVKQVLEQGIPLPYPLTKEESEVYSGERFMNLGIEITPFPKGLGETSLNY